MTFEVLLAQDLLRDVGKSAQVFKSMPFAPVPYMPLMCVCVSSKNLLLLMMMTHNYTIQWTLYNVHFSMRSGHYTLCTVQRPPR